MDLVRMPWVLLLTAFLALLSVLVVETWPMNKHRSKRTILQMCGLIRFYTNRSCLEYNNYGCFCGLGNAGRKPLDTIDACCWRHDYCYGLVNCFWMYPQWVGYGVHCDETGCVCTDSMEESPCSRTTCECDLRFASCLTEGQFHSHYSNYNRVLCAQQPWQEDVTHVHEEAETGSEANNSNSRPEIQEQTETILEGSENSSRQEDQERSENTVSEAAEDSVRSDIQERTETAVSEVIEDSVSSVIQERTEPISETAEDGLQDEAETAVSEETERNVHSDNE